MKDENEYLLNHRLYSRQNIPQCAGFCHPALTE